MSSSIALEKTCHLFLKLKKNDNFKMIKLISVLFAAEVAKKSRLKPVMQVVVFAGAASTD